MNLSGRAVCPGTQTDLASNFLTPCAQHTVMYYVMLTSCVVGLSFILELRRELGDRFEHFQTLHSFVKSSFVLGSEAWEEYSVQRLCAYIVYGRGYYYGEHSNVHQSHSQNASGGSLSPEGMVS